MRKMTEVQILKIGSPFRRKARSTTWPKCRCDCATAFQKNCVPPCKTADNRRPANFPVPALALRPLTRQVAPPPVTHLERVEIKQDVVLIVEPDREGAGHIGRACGRSIGSGLRGRTRVGWQLEDIADDSGRFAGHPPRQRLPVPGQPARQHREGYPRHGCDSGRHGGLSIGGRRKQLEVSFLRSRQRLDVSGLHGLGPEICSPGGRV